MSERERGLDRLRGWTAAAVIGAAALTALFAILAAGTFPGNQVAPPSAPSDGSGQPGDAQANPLQTGGDQQRPVAQPPSGGFFGSGSTGGAGRIPAVSGGS